MQLQPGERSILATFESWPAAEEAKQALLASGFETVQLDRTGDGGYDVEVNSSRPVFGDVTSQTAVLYDAPATRLLGDDVRRVRAAFPEVSGMAGDLTARGHGVLLTAVVSEERLQEALGIIRQHGGRD